MPGKDIVTVYVSYLKLGFTFKDPTFKFLGLVRSNHAQQQ